MMITYAADDQKFASPRYPSGHRDNDIQVEESWNAWKDRRVLGDIQMAPREMARQETMFSIHQKKSHRRLSFGGSSKHQFVIQPMGNNEYSALYFNHGKLRREYHVFAFVWFHVRDNEVAPIQKRCSPLPPLFSYPLFLNM